MVPGKAPLKADSWLSSNLCKHLGLVCPLLPPLVYSFLPSWRPGASGHLTSSPFLQVQDG